MKTLLAAIVFALVACGGQSGVTTTPVPGREVRMLDANDVALRPVVFAAAKHLFDPNAAQTIGFGGVFVNKKVEESLSSDVYNYIARNGGFKATSRPVDCEGAAAPRATAPRAPTTTATGGAPNPSSQPTRTTGSSICNRGADAIYSFNAFRIAYDTAYVEVQVSGVAKSGAKCLSLIVDKEGGGWRPGELKSSKIGKCGA